MRLRSIWLSGCAAAGMAAAAAMAQPAPQAAPAPPPPPAARNAQMTVIQKGPGSGYLGIGGLEVTSEKAKSLNLKEERGVLVSSVAEDSPAAKAGLKEGDVVLEFNGMRVEGTAQFQRLVSEMPPGRQVKITVWRNGATQTLTATIGTRKDQVTVIEPGDANSWSFQMPNMRELHLPEMGGMNIPRFDMLTPAPALGIYGESLGDAEQLAAFFGVTDGVLVRSVKQGSAAEKAGIKAGDVITKVDDERVTSTSDITRALRAARRSKSAVTVTVVRSKKEMPVTVTIESTGGTTRAGRWQEEENFFPGIR